MGLFKRRPEAITASAAQISRRALNRRGTSTQTWQQELALYIKHGPGLVGMYCDTIEDKILTGQVKFEYQQQDGTWTDLPPGSLRNVSLGVFNAFKNPFQTPHALLGRWARLQVSMGEVWHVGLPRNHILEHYMAHTKEFETWVPPVGDAPGSVVWRDPYTGLKQRIHYPQDQFARSWWGEDDDPSLPTSELRRALPHIRELIDLRRRGHADTRSRLVANDMLAFGEGSELYENAADEEDPLNGLPQTILDYMDLANLEVNTPYWERQTVAESVPFPMLGVKPEKVEVGRPLDPELTQSETQALLHISHALRVPTRWLLEGPGSGKYNNENSLAASVIDDAVGPVAFRVFADFTSLYFRPRLEDVLTQIHIPGADPSKVRCSFDLDSIRPKPDHITDGFKAWDRGLVSREALQNITQFELLKIPEGMTDWEFWQVTQGLAQGAGAGGSMAAGKALAHPGNSGGSRADKDTEITAFPASASQVPYGEVVPPFSRRAAIQAREASEAEIEDRNRQARNLAERTRLLELSVAETRAMQRRSRHPAATPEPTPQPAPSKLSPKLTGAHSRVSK